MNKNYTIHPSPCGNLIIEYENNKITLIDKAPHNLSVDSSQPTELTRLVSKQLNEYFDGKRKNFDFPYSLEGTDFQKKVWKALLDIPYGETRSYKDIAISVGSPKGFRAVGMANNKNPISIAIPCHRVIGSNGSLIGYGGGLDMKTFLLELEKNSQK